MPPFEEPFVVGHRRVILTVLMAALAGCGTVTAPGDDSSAAELRTAPLSADLAGKALVLETYIWRDFMPSSPPDGKPMIAVLRIRTSDGSPVPAEIRAERAWVIFGDLVWSDRPREETDRQASAPGYEVVLRDGPRWGPGVSVDVVVRLRDGEGRTILVRAADQPIHRTD